MSPKTDPRIKHFYHLLGIHDPLRPFMAHHGDICGTAQPRCNTLYPNDEIVGARAMPAKFAENLQYSVDCTTDFIQRMMRG